MKARVARRGGLPTLHFYFLVHRASGKWMARSVLTGHVAESATERGALENLTIAIDVAIEVAERYGASVEQWYEAQQPDQPRYLAMFIAAMGGDAKHRHEKAPSGRFVLDAHVLRAA